MKRFVVLCSVVALVSLYVPTAWSTAPAISDLPDVRVLTGGTPPPKGVISSGLNQVEFDAYNIEEFIQDFDDAIGDLSVSLTDHTNIEAPTLSGLPSSLPPTTAISPAHVILGVDNLVDVYGRSTTGWTRYTAQVDDASNPVSQETAVVKYSTFAMGTPSLSEGRFFNLTADGWQFAYAWMGEDIVVSDLDVTITPSTAVDWVAYMNSIEEVEDANGNLLGLNPVYVAHGSSFTADGWSVAISPTGGLVLSTGATMSPGPYLIGILAVNQADDQDIDATRLLVSQGMLGLATPGGYPEATHANSETLDGLSTGPITTPAIPTVDTRVPIRDGSHWTYSFFNNDKVLTPASLEIVTLTSDPDLPPAADPSLMKGVIDSPAVGTIAGGNAIKATFDIAGTVGVGADPPAFRLLSRVFTGVQAGEVYTFAANIATDITNATHAPNMLMAMGSVLGEAAMGFNLNRVVAPGTTGVLSEYQKDIVPDETEGWQTLSVNWTPPLTRKWFDTNGDGVMDQTDIDFIADNIGAPQGWSDPTVTANAMLIVKGHTGMTTNFHVWLDNLRVYRSAYELDLGLAKTEYNAPASTAGILPPIGIPEPTGNIDGTFESYSNTGDINADLDAIGFALDNATGLGPKWRRTPYGPLAANISFKNADAASFSVVTNVDHTKANNSQRALQIALTGTEGPVVTGDGQNIRAQLVSAIVAAEGSGIYCMEVFVSKARATNINETDRTPKYTVALNQMAPNALGPAYGASLDQGGVPNSVGEDGWMRIVATAYIPDAQLLRGVLTVQESFTDPAVNFGVPNYFDDLRLYRVDDPAKFFDADLFDAS